MSRATGAARGFIPVELDKCRHLFFTMGAMKALKVKYGFKLSRVTEFLAESADGEPNYDNIAIVAAVGLQHEDPTITPDWILENVPLSVMLEELLPKVLQSFGVALGNAGEGTVAPPQVTGTR
jgi:hypothetical protein